MGKTLLCCRILFCFHSLHLLTNLADLTSVAAFKYLEKVQKSLELFVLVFMLSEHSIISPCFRRAMEANAPIYLCVQRNIQRPNVQNVSVTFCVCPLNPSPLQVTTLPFDSKGN